MAAIVLAIIFYKSSTQKLKNAYGFYRIVSEEYKLISKPKAAVLSPLLAAIEFIVVIWLLTPWMQVFGFIMVVCLQVLFLAVLIPRKGDVLKYGCGCFGLNTPKEITSRDIVRNSAILCVASIFSCINLLGY
jgi:hypothetical protein